MTRDPLKVLFIGNSYTTRNDLPGLITKYLAIGRELGATVVPVGLAWETFGRTHTGPPLYDRDQSHPSVAGSYLAACVFLATLFGSHPVGHRGDVSGLDPADRERLQAVARDVTAAFAHAGFERA